MPVTATARSAPERLSAPSAIARATSSETAPWVAIRSAGTPSISRLRGVGIGDEAALEDGGRARDLGDGGGDEAAGAAFGGGDPDPARSRARDDVVRRAHAMITAWASHASDGDADGRHRTGDHIVEHGAERIAAAIGPADRTRLADVEEPEEQEGGDPARPRERPGVRAGEPEPRRERPEREPLARDLVDDDLGRVVVRRCRASRLASPTQPSAKTASVAAAKTGKPPSACSGHASAHRRGGAPGAGRRLQGARSRRGSRPPGSCSTPASPWRARRCLRAGR